MNDSKAKGAFFTAKEVNGELWYLLGKRGLFRAAMIDKRKNPVLDWDGHHCDEALAKGSIRFFPKTWDFQ